MDAVDDETGYFIVKRAPVGGGAWKRTTDLVYSSAYTTLNSELTINDTGKEITMASSQNKSVVWKRMMKRASSHYLGGDLDYGKSHFTIIGDHLRFILMIAYKQNPKSHSNILVFGDFKDINDGQFKTVLEGYVNSQIGNVGFNRMFAYPAFSLLEDRLLIQTSNSQPSGIGWILSSQSGDVDYLRGAKDSGHHIYPVLIPSEVGV